MKWTQWYIIIMVTLVTLYLIGEYNRPRTIDWSRTYKSQHKIPFGTYIYNAELKNYFPSAKITQLQSPLYNHMNNSVAANEIYMVVAQSIGAVDAEVDELIKYVERGNTVFLATEWLNDGLEDSFKVEISRYTDFFLDDEKNNTDTSSHFDTESDSIVINLANPVLQSKNYYGLRSGLLDAHFAAVDTGNTTILGVNNLGQPNFIRIKKGKGYLFLHCLPQAFTNYFILKENNIDYVNKITSYLPKEATSIYWSNYYTSNTQGSTTPLHVIFSKTNLKWAYFIALWSMVLYVLFNIKRRQRIIPVMQPPRNDSKEFVETVSRVYFNQKHHLNIAQKKINFWLDTVRTRFGITTKTLNEEFVVALANRSGADADTIKNIIGWIVVCNARPNITANELLTINKLIDTFYKQAK